MYYTKNSYPSIFITYLLEINPQAGEPSTLPPTQDTVELEVVGTAELELNIQALCYDYILDYANGETHSSTLKRKQKIYINS